jgi:ribose/xylose/arabinose/galactoside ABC-type transport system permease subunit
VNTDGLPIQDSRRGLIGSPLAISGSITVFVVIAILLLGLLYFLLSETSFSGNVFAFGGNDESTRLVGFLVFPVISHPTQSVLSMPNC